MNKRIDNRGRDGGPVPDPWHVDPRAVLSADDADSLAGAHQSAVADFMERETMPSNLVGFGAGVKWTNGEPTGEPAVLAFVQQKVTADALAPADLLPETHEGRAVDVVEVGQLFAGVDVAPMPVELERPSPDGAVGVLPRPLGGGGLPTLNRRMRPAQGGFSVGHKHITAGTIGTGAYDMLPGGTTNPPRPGIGAPVQYYVLSNNHVLANSNAGIPGDPVLQPGPFDGGTDPADRIGVLTRFVPIQFEPPIPRPLHRNVVDCAVAAADLRDIDREVYWIEDVRGWRLSRRRPGYPSPVAVGTLVQKTGRTTGWTMGRITAIRATVDVNYRGGRLARFHDQIVTTPMSAPGDSGSLLVSLDRVALGLLFAGSQLVTIFNQIENVRSLLRIEVAQRVL